MSNNNIAAALDDQKVVHANLFDYTADELLVDKVLTYYELLKVPEFASSDDIKKAFRKASLKYHPDKLSNSSDDGVDREYVFLALRQAHDTLMDPALRQAYDSTVLPFDDSIPADRSKLVETCLYEDDDFYAVFGPVFERNLRFDARIRTDAVVNGNNNNSNNGNKKSKKNNNSSNNRNSVKPPSFGDADTPIEEVYKFYEYWIHFESWRDFSGQAAAELQVEQELENAESRFEKRWLQKEIDKRSKQLKRLEMQRVQTLVERAQQADPRLRAHKAAQAAAKEQAHLERKQREVEAEAERERQAQLVVEKEQQEKERLAQEKVEREQAKKELRKARQTLRKMASSSFESAKDAPWEDAYEMSKDVDYLCMSLSRQELENLHKDLSTHDAPEATLHSIKAKAEKLREEPTTSTCNGHALSQNNSTTNKSLDTTTNGNQTTAAGSLSNSVPANSTTKSVPWTKDELSALAKAVRKYPPGGANRWDQIALFVNNLCRQDQPRSKEECIEKYNSVARSSKPETATTPNGNVESNGINTNASTENIDNSSNVDDVWTLEQDQQLQDGLAKFSATMDKNERWTKIAQNVQGKTKKQCVQRFKTIREALKKK